MSICVPHIHALVFNLIFFSPGDIVGVFVGGKSPTEKPLSGIVTRSTDTSVSVAFDDLQEFVDISAHDGSLQVVKLANDVTYKRIKRWGWGGGGLGRRCN